MKFSTEVLLAQYGHVEQQIALAATKTGLLVTAYSVLVTAYVVYSKECLTAMQGDLLASENRLGLLISLTGLALLVGLMLSLYAVLPRSKSEQHEMLFYGAIAKKHQGYAAKWKDAQDEDIVNWLLTGVVGKSQWLRSKYRVVSLAIWCAIGATLLTFGVAIYARFVLDSPVCKSPSATAQMVGKTQYHQEKLGLTS